MEELKKYVFENYIQKILNISDDKKYINEEDFLSLDLTNSEKNFIFKLMEEKDIFIKKSKKILDENPYYVRNYVYGEAELMNNRKNEESIMAKLEYLEDGRLISENFTALDDYLKNEFIPNNINYQKKVDPKTLEMTITPSIQLNKILDKKFSEAEIEHIINYLNNLDINVNGRSDTFEDDFNNYNYILTYKHLELPKMLPKVEQKKLFSEYKKTNDLQIKEKLIEGNLRLVPFFTYRYAIATGIDLEELNSYGYEGLIEAVDAYDLSRGEFSTCAYYYIKSNVIAGIAEIEGFKRGDYYSAFSLARSNVEKKHDEKLRENPYLVDEIVDSLIEKGHISPKLYEDNRRRIQLSVCDSLENHIEDENCIDNNTLYYETVEEFDLLQLREIFNEIFNGCLKEKEIKVIERRFGFNDENIKTLEEIGKELNISRAGVFAIEERALLKLRHPSRIKKLRGFIESGIDEYCFDPKGIIDVPNKVKRK